MKRILLVQLKMKDTMVLGGKLKFGCISFSFTYLGCLTLGASCSDVSSSSSTLLMPPEGFSADSAMVVFAST